MQVGGGVLGIRNGSPIVIFFMEASTSFVGVGVCWLFRISLESFIVLVAQFFDGGVYGRCREED